jgi:uncharacterized protein YndB with AHSA1/START domain
VRKLDFKIDIHTEPRLVLRAFIDESMLRGWWHVERSLIQPRNNGMYILAWNLSESGFGFITSGRINKYKPGKFLDIDKVCYMNPGKPLLGPMRIRIRVESRQEMTRLFLRQSGYGKGTDWDWYFVAVKEAWPAVLHQLKGFLEERSGST